MTVDAMGAEEVTKVGGRAFRWRGTPGTPTFKPVTQSHDGRMGERRREWPTGSVVLNGENDGSVSVGFDTMRLPGDLREHRGRLNQELGSDCLGSNLSFSPCYLWNSGQVTPGSLCLRLLIWRVGTAKNSDHVVGLMWRANAFRVMRMGSDPQSTAAVGRF